jgi:hypothetical protein
MAAIAMAFDRALGIQVDVQTMKPVGIFCGTGLALSLLLAGYGLDLSEGFL